jgi:hypothetical protein
LNSGASRSDVVTGFSESSEFRAKTSVDVDAYMTSQFSGEHQGAVYRLYKATLNREPDSEGLVGWLGSLDTGEQTIQMEARGFVESAEFRNTYGALSNSQFVTLLYRNVLGREPDQGGLSAWSNALDQGASRADVVVGFSNSSEFRESTASGQANFMASRFGSWSDALLGGSGNNTLIGGRGADVFVFDSSNPGNDQVYGLEKVDQLRFSGFGYGGVADVMGHMTQDGQNVVFADGGQTITFHHATLGQLSQANFLLTA